MKPDINAVLYLLEVEGKYYALLVSCYSSRVYVIMVNKLRPIVLLFCLLVDGIAISSAVSSHDQTSTKNDVDVKRLHELGLFLLPVPEDKFDHMVMQMVEQFVPVNAASQQCQDHSKLLLDKFLQQELWAVKMLDAGSKLGSGVLDGHLQDLGNYEECINIEEPNKLFSGLHCVIDTASLVPELFAGAVSTFSVCVPSSCSDEDVADYLDLVLAPLNVSTRPFVDINEASGLDRIICSSKVSPSFRIKDYIAIIIFGLILNLVILGSIPGQKSELLTCFSLKDNFNSLMDTSEGKGEISCLNGLRVISVITVMSYHQLLMSLASPVDRLTTLTEKFGAMTLGFVQLWTKTMEVFFLLGGTVLSYSFLRNMKSTDKFNMKKYCLLRYFRLTPVLFMMVLYNATVFIHSGQGPVWTKSIHYREDKCNKNWWTSLLHISTIVNPNEMCLGESWYVACVYQLHILAPILLLPLYHRPRVGLFLLLLCVFASSVGTGVFAYVKEMQTGDFTALIFKDRVTDLSGYLREYYAFYLRAPPFLIGIALGYFLFQNREKETRQQLTKRVLLLGWTASAVLLVGLIVYTTQLVDPSHHYCAWTDTLYYVLARPLFSLVVAWVILVCDLGYGGKLNSFLSHSMFRPLARLTYSVYLIGGTVQIAQAGMIRVAPAFSFLDQIFIGVGALEIAYCLAVVMYLTVEIPIFKVAFKFLKDSEKPLNSKKESE